MPNDYISQITLPNNSTYDIHDARITGGVLNFVGFSATQIQEGDAATGYNEGDVILYGNKEFVAVTKNNSLV